MANTSLYFLDFGLSTMIDGVLQGRILTCDSDGQDLKPVVEGLRAFPDGIGITDNHIYYTAMGNPKQNNGSIWRIGLNGEDHHTVVPAGETWTPKQLQVVPELGKLFWCDREGMRVIRCDLDGSHIEVLVVTGKTEEDRLDARNWCVGIAVDPARRLIYWTQKGPSKGNAGRLFSAGLDIPAGEDATSRSDIKLLLDNLPEPIDLDLHHEENALYMTDRGDPPFGNSISKIQLGPKSVVGKKILVRKLHEAIGLALDVKGGKMYFTDLNGSLYKANLDGSEEVTLFSEIGDLTGVACLSKA